MPVVHFVGAPHPVHVDVPVRIAILPASQVRQRPGGSFWGGKPDRYIQHDTGNRGLGANALMHQRYLEQGAPDKNGFAQQLGYHLTVDDREAVQLVPFDEPTWHGGDLNGPCNLDSLSCELCINADGDEMKARSNAEKLAAAIMPLWAPRLKLGKHQDCSGKYCPQDMLGDGYWPIFDQRVDERIQGGTATPRFASPVPLDVGEWDGRDRFAGGTHLVAFRRTWIPEAPTPVRQRGSHNAPKLREDLPGGTLGEFMTDYLFVSLGEVWGYSPFHSRIPMQSTPAAGLLAFLQALPRP